MDTMLPSPGFSIPSVGTPLHQPEEDQQILLHAQQQQQQPQQQHGMQNPPPLQPMGLSLPHKQHTYAPSAVGFTTPQSLMQPQTPVIFYIINLLKQFKYFNIDLTSNLLSFTFSKVLFK